MPGNGGRGTRKPDGATEGRRGDQEGGVSGTAGRGILYVLAYRWMLVKRCLGQVVSQEGRCLRWAGDMGSR